MNLVCWAIVLAGQTSLEIDFSPLVNSSELSSYTRVMSQNASNAPANCFPKDAGDLHSH